MDERLKFIAGVLDGEKMAPLCREFSISRKTGSRSSGATTTAASKPSQIDRAGPIATPTSCPFRSRP